MKKLILFFSLIFVLTNIRSSNYFEFPTDSSTWSYCYYGMISNTLRACERVDHYGIYGDTVIKSTKYSKLYFYSQEKNDLTSNNPGFILNLASYIGAIRNDDLKKYFL